MSREKGWNSSTLVIPERKSAKTCPGNIAGARIQVAGRSLNQTGRIRTGSQKIAKTTDAMLVKSLIDRGTQKVLKVSSSEEEEDFQTIPAKQD